MNAGRGNSRGASVSDEFYGRHNARSTLDPDELERYAQEGRAMTLDESVAYALETTIDALAPHDHSGVR